MNESHGYEIVKYSRVANAVFRKYAKEKGVENEWYLDNRFKYIDQDCPTLYYFNVEYNGYIYEEKYFSGCFQPYIIRNKKTT